MKWFKLIARDEVGFELGGDNMFQKGGRLDIAGLSSGFLRMGATTASLSESSFEPKEDLISVMNEEIFGKQSHPK